MNGWDFCKSYAPNNHITCWYHWKNVGDRITAICYWFNQKILIYNKWNKKKETAEELKKEEIINETYAEYPEESKTRTMLKV